MKRFFFSVVTFFLFVPSVVMADEKVTINEFLPHPGTGEKEWVEIYNPQMIDLQNYWLDDDTSFQEDSGSSSKKRVENLSQTNQYVVLELSSMFNNNADAVVLFDSVGNLVDQFSYTDDPGVNISLGRSPDGIGVFEILSVSTRGNANSQPQPTPTETPTPTVKPTITPKPSPTSKLNPTVKKDPIITKSVSPLLSYAEGTKIPTKLLRQVSSKSVATNAAYPTAVLGTASASKNITVSKKPVFVKEAHTDSSFPLMQWISSGIGCILCACGIIFFIWKKRKQANSE